jgi:anthranilate phosphoribosyltransferase
MCVASMSFAYDWGRIIFLAAPVFYVAAAHVLRNRPRLAVATVITLLAVDLGYGIYVQVSGVAHGLEASVSHEVY